MTEDRIVANVVANARLEGLICDEDDVAAMQRIVSGATTLDAELDAVEAKYRGLGSGAVQRKIQSGKTRRT